MKRRHHYQMVLSLLVGTSLCLIALPNANGQGLFRRLRARAQAVAPQPQYRPPYRVQVPTRPSVPVPATPSPKTAVPEAGRSRVTPPVIQIDPRTGRAVVARPSGLRPTVTQPNPVTQPNQRPSQTILAPMTAQPSTTPRQSTSPEIRSKSETANKPKQFGDSILKSKADDSSASALPARSSLGLTVVRATSGPQGMDVVGFREASLADEAGLRLGDRILFLNGQPTPDAKALGRMLATLPPGQSVSLRIGRGNRVGDIRVPLVAASTATTSLRVAKKTLELQPSKSHVANPPEPGKSVDSANDNGVRLGVKIADQPGSRGVIVTLVEPDSPAEAAGFLKGDRIVSVDGRMVTNTDSLARELSVRSANQPMAVQLVRQNQLRASTVSFHESAKSQNEKTVSPKSAESSAKVDDAPSDGILGGVGSMIDGLFGGKPAETKAANSSQGKSPSIDNKISPAKHGESAKSQPASSPDASSEAVGDAPKSASPVLSGPVTNAGLVEDEMAFGDKEPINQVIFAKPQDLPTIPERKLDDDSSRQSKSTTMKADPPSAAKILPPEETAVMKLTPPKVTKPKSESQRIADLEAEVQRLKKLLESEKAK